MFENLSQNALADQHVLTHKKPSKWDKPAVQKSSDVSVTNAVPSMSLGHQNHDVICDVDDDGRPVHGSSTVFVVEDELPPPAFTRNIVAKFRELEASNVDKTVPLPGKVTSTPSRSSHSSNIESRRYQFSQHSRPATEDDVTDSSLFTSPAGRQNGEERGRTGRRSEVRERESSTSLERSVDNDLPQEGTARSLLARWRTIEQQASRDSDDTPRRSNSGTARSHSTSRIEVRRPYKAERPSTDDEQEALSTRYLFTEYD